MIKPTALALTSMSTGVDMKDAGKMICKTVMEKRRGQMGPSTTETIRKARNMGKVTISGPTGHPTTEPGSRTV